MKSVKIKLDNIESVKKFVNILGRYDHDFDLVSDRYVIDAKSIMGIFSLNLKNAIELHIHAEEPVVSEVIQNLRDYIIS